MSPSAVVGLLNTKPAIARWPSARSASLSSRMSPSRLIAPVLLLAGPVGVGSIPQPGNDGEWLSRRLLHRRHTFERLNPADQQAGRAAGVVGGGVKAVIARQRLRIVVDREVEIFRLVRRRDRHEGGENLVLRIAPVDDLVRGPGLPADVIAGNVGESRRPVGR